VIAQMGFRPAVARELRAMDPRIFQPRLMGLSADIGRKPRGFRSERVARWHDAHRKAAQ
jgi:propionate CoA-transferase